MAPSPIRQMVRRAKRLIRQFQGKDVWISPQIRIPYKIYGNEHGGWAVAEKGLDSRSVIYSVGVGRNISFDLAMIDRFRLNIHAFDPTPLSIQWLSEQKLPDAFHFHPVGLADFDGIAHFDLPSGPGDVSFHYAGHGQTTGRQVQAPVKCLQTLMHELGHQAIDVLKMDIEGAEYQVIPNILKNNLSVKQLLVEFHHQSSNHPPQETRQAIDALNQSGFRIFYISPMGWEYSFIRC